ncbi:MAG TPA: glycosyltransferase [Candidatus Polarisedimenticolia bacterium]|nr:glycosyltransferase [Candidatus Polarisedimenticolia bacterium]
MTEALPAARPQLSVLVPCYNEALNLPEFVERTLAVLDGKGIDGEIVLVDDGSADGTAAVIRSEEERRQGRVRGVFHPVNRGIEQGWRSALEASRGAYVCLIDADLQNQPEDIYRLYREIRFSHVDFVQGTRSSIGRLRDGRYVLSKGLNVLLNLCFGMRARDNKSGFVLCHRDVLAEILRHRHRYRYFQTFISVAAHARGYSIREVETLFESRIHGTSFIARRLPIALILRALVDVAKGIHEYRLSRTRDLLVEPFLQSHLPGGAPPPALRGMRRLWFRIYTALMPLHHWMISRDAAYYHEVLDRSQWLPAGVIRAIQEAKLRRLISHAYRHVPYYREMMDDAGIRPEEIATLEDLRRLPLLDKDTIRKNLYFDLMSDSHQKKDVYRVATSGSTGQPLVVWVDRRQLEIRWASTLRSQHWTGYRFGDRTVRLWHQTIGMDRVQVIKERLDALLCRRRFVPAFELSAARVRAMERLIRRHRPSLVDGYAESFHYLARLGLDPGLRELGIKGVMSSAQTLDAGSRKAIEDSFGTRVFDKYGSREFSGIAYECEAHQGHHVVAESYIVEILVGGRPALPGELGEVVVTDLNNLVMPFVRYRLGDLAYAVADGDGCPCGRGLPRIGAVEGRVQSIVVGANGAAVPGSFFPHLLKDYGYALARFQIEQEEPGSITFRFVPGSRFHPHVLEEIFASVRRFLGEGLRIRPEQVDAIAMVRTGKHHAVINRAPISSHLIERLVDPRSVGGS